MKTLVLVDGHSLAYRMHFALERTNMRTSGDKKPTWAVYGFFNALFSLLKKMQPDAIAVSFDVGRVTFRTERYADYKAHREKMPDELRAQMAAIREGVEKLGIPIYEMDHYEADDVIGTLARRGAEQGYYVQILTGDQDAFQLVCAETRECSGKIEVLIPPRSPREDLKYYDGAAVLQKMGVHPDQVTDFKGLKGDSSDNIPGVPGVGDKTAVKLLGEYRTLENLYTHLEELPKNKLLEKLQTYQDQAFLSKELATICTEVPIEVDLDDCHLSIPDLADLLAYFDEYEFKTFRQQATTLLAPFLNNGNSGGGESPPIERSALSRKEVDSSQQAASGSVENQGAASQTALLEKMTAHLSVDHEIVTTPDQLSALLTRLKETGVFALDLETMGLDPLNDGIVGIAISVAGGLARAQRPAVNLLGLSDYPESFSVLSLDHSIDEAAIETFYIPLQHQDQKTVLSREEVFSSLKPLLEDPGIVKIAHNAKFEINVFRTAGIQWEGLVFDTMIASYVENPERRHGLKSLGFDCFQYTMQEIKELIGTGKSQRTFDQVPLAEAAAYAACDSFVTLKLAEYFIARLDEDQTTLLYEVELPLMHVLAEMEYTGIALDTEYLSGLSRDLGEQLAVIEADIYEQAGCTFNLNSPKQVGEVLFEKLGIPPAKKTKSKSGYSTDVKVLEQLAPKYPIVGRLLEYRQLFKLKSTYIDALPALINPKTGRLHTSFNQTVTATGRLSSSNPNLQNIPIRSDLGRQIRKAFIPGHQEGTNGWQLLSVDYSQIELRLLAHFSEDPNLVEAFQNNEDVHTATAALVFGMPREKVTKDQRYKAKAVNFGVIYGQSAYGLSQQLGIPTGEAAEFINRYFSRYKNVRRFIDETIAEAHRTGRVKTIAGRVRDLSEGLGNSNRNIREFSERAAFNMPLQGSAADLMKIAMIRLHRMLKRSGAQSRILLQVHDELVLEVPDEERLVMIKEVEQAMALDQPLRVPLVVDVHLGPSWMES